MQFIKISLIFILLCLAACRAENNPNKEIPQFLLKFPKGSFAYPVGEKDFVTEKMTGGIIGITRRILEKTVILAKIGTKRRVEIRIAGNPSMPQPTGKLL